jgi:hypothetical protein
MVWKWGNYTGGRHLSAISPPCQEKSANSTNQDKGSPGLHQSKAVFSLLPMMQTVSLTWECRTLRSMKKNLRLNDIKSLARHSTLIYILWGNTRDVLAIKCSIKNPTYSWTVSQQQSIITFILRQLPDLNVNSNDFSQWQWLYQWAGALSLTLHSIRPMCKPESAQGEGEGIELSYVHIHTINS